LSETYKLNAGRIRKGRNVDRDEGNTFLQRGLTIRWRLVLLFEGLRWWWGFCFEREIEREKGELESEEENEGGWGFVGSLTSSAPAIVLRAVFVFPIV
jgi:hypothetical protein